MRTLFRTLPLACLLWALAAPASSAPTPQEAKTPPPEAERHPSGLVTLRLAPGEGDRSPMQDDIVALHFTGWDREAKQFASSREGQRPRPLIAPVSSLFPGWREAVLSMVVGESLRVWVPDHLGPKNNAGPKSAVFDLELLGIRELPEVPPLTPPDDARRTESGARFKVVKASDATEAAPPGGTVLLEWSLWTAEGRMVDSTAVRGRPTAFMLDRVLIAFAEAVESMKVGESRHVWIPAAVHGGQWPKAPKGKDLVFSLELIRVMPNSMLPREG